MSVTSQLDQLEHAQLVRRLAEEELAYLFKHALTQETAYASLLKETRHVIHRRVADSLETLYPDRLDENAALLAHHFAQANDEPKTLAYALRAGDVAARKSANAEAIAHYTQALEIAKRTPDPNTALLELYTKRGRVFELMGNYGQALENYDEMEALAQARGDRALELGALMARTTILSTPTAQFDPTRARELSDRALVIARELADREAEAKILWNLMLLYHFTARFQEAIQYGEQAIALARALNLRERLAYALNDIGRPYLASQQFERGVTALREAQSLWRALDNKPMLADNLNTLVNAASASGDYDQALALSNEAYELGQSINNRWTMAHSLMNASLIHADRGETALAINMMEECLQLAQSVGFFVAIGIMRDMLANVYADLGNLDKAFAFVNATLTPAEHAGVWDANTLGIRAQLSIRQGDLVQARELLRTSQLSQGNAPLGPMPSVATLIAQFELALVEHDSGRANAIIDKLFPIMRMSNLPFLRITGMVLKARMFFAEQRFEDAEAVLNEARADAEHTGSRRELWQILALLSDIEMKRGDQTRATELATKARATLEFIIAHTPEEFRASFSNLPNIRKIMEA